MFGQASPLVLVDNCQDSQRELSTSFFHSVERKISTRAEGTSLLTLSDEHRWADMDKHLVERPKSCAGLKEESQLFGILRRPSPPPL